MSLICLLVPSYFCLVPPRLPSPYSGRSDFETGKNHREGTLTAVWSGMHYNAMSQLQSSLGDREGRHRLPWSALPPPGKHLLHVSSSTTTRKRGTQTWPPIFRSKDLGAQSHVLQPLSNWSTAIPEGDEKVLHCHLN